MCKGKLRQGNKIFGKNVELCGEKKAIVITGHPRGLTIFTGALCKDLRVNVFHQKLDLN